MEIKRAKIGQKRVTGEQARPARRASRRRTLPEKEGRTLPMPSARCRLAIADAALSVVCCTPLPTCLVFQSDRREGASRCWQYRFWLLPPNDLCLECVLPG